MRAVNSAFFAALQDDSVHICELINLNTRTNSWKWSTTNKPIVSSGDEYVPFPGMPTSGVEESIDLGVSFIDFVVANSSDLFDDLLKGSEFNYADIQIRRVIPNTPDLGSMIIYTGKLGEYSYDRKVLSGRARSILGAVTAKWPYYTYMDQCAVRFGGSACGFNTASITITGSLELSADRYNIKVSSPFFSNSAYSINHFEFGKFTSTTGANSGVVRTVFANSGDWLTISQKLPFDVSSGDQFSLYRGCKKQLVSDCKSLFNNASNFLGFPWIPRQESAF